VNYRRLLAVIVLTCCSGLATASSISLSEQASLQAAMQRHIDNALVQGRYLYLDAAKGEVRPLRPMAAHPIIMRMGEYFVLCSDFRDDQGADVNIDFYIARKGRSFVVFDEQVENRALIKKLMKRGMLSRVD
jgi:hypothetical protein